MCALPCLVRAQTPQAAGQLRPGPGGPYLWVEGTRPGGRTLLLSRLQEGRRITLYDGPLGPVGRDGERSVEVVVSPAGVEQYQTAPGMVRCDGEQRLFAQRWDEHGGWKPEAAPLPANPQRLRTSSAAPAGLRERPLPVYRFVAASRQAGPAEAEQRADLLTPPRELEDGVAESAWIVSGDPRGAWVTARADGKDHEVRALRLLPPAGKAQMPRTLAVIFADGKSVLLEVTAGKGAQWVRLAQPVRGPCISLQIVSPTTAHGEVTGIGEVGIYSEMEGQGPGGLASLAADKDAAAGEAAARSLLLLPDAEVPAALQALGEVLLGAQGEGRRRLQGVLAQLAQRLPLGRPREQAAALLLRALGTAPPEEQPPLWAALEKLGEDAQEALLQLGQDPSQPPPLRAEALSRLGTSLQAVTALLKLSEGTALQAPLRRAVMAGLARATRCLGPDEPRLAAVRQSLEQASPPERTADLLEVVAAGAAGCPGPQKQYAEKALLAAWQRLAKAGPEAFVARYRALQGLGRLGVTSPEGAAVLREVLWQGEDPVLRETAARAAATLPMARYGEIARRGLMDPDPGVRLAALLSLSGMRDAATVSAIEQALHADGWPQVRRAAAEARAAACDLPRTRGGAGARAATLRRALSDPDDEVRRRALSGIVRCEGPGAAALLADTARNSAVAPGLRGLACTLAAGLGGRSSQGMLSDALIEALQDPEADERHVGLVMSCARALGHVGGPEAVPALLQAAGEPVSAPVRMAGFEALGLLCRHAGPQPDRKLRQALLAAGKDPDRRVRAAAAAAAQRCATSR